MKKLIALVLATFAFGAMAATAPVAASAPTKAHKMVKTHHAKHHAAKKAALAPAAKK